MTNDPSKKKTKTSPAGGPKAARPSKKTAATVSKQVQQESPNATGHNDI